MDTHFEWREDFKIGVDVIDKEHQRLFQIINKIFTFKEEDKDSQWICDEGIKFFKAHAVKHFEDEENYMESIRYDGLEQHRQIHTGFRENTLPSLEQELEQTDYSSDAVDHFLGVCAGWLIGHTLTEDLSIVGKSSRKWKKLLSSKDLTVMKKVIVQLVFDMFHLESRMISDVYGGEKFGSGIYYRLVYGTDEDEKQHEVFMVFEEKLLINTVGKIMGIQSNKLDAMLTHASRYVTRQFVGRIMEQFPDLASYELKQENLLSYEQFQQAFEKENLQVSLLFDTGEGYFSYCVVAPHLPQNNVGPLIGVENAMTEVEKYLAKREEQQADAAQKPKILIVDDSMTVRQSMKQLLEEDYEIELVESGVAAIRAITLDQPDLVLLDYEMPVCDGRQTLEMIRSYEAFTDISVIFLTGKSDPDSMIKVMPLKPSGYLLKHSKPEELKKEIDDFFEKKQA
ncbi:MAG: response regulator [Firmicutes bacterium]|jgi:hemerythrin-like metal-binding protein|nr:response regulator [Bacillota bacterium]